MDIQKIESQTKTFNNIIHTLEGESEGETIEIWFERELQTVLGYAKWENFSIAIGRAIQSCKTLKINVEDHFREVRKIMTNYNVEQKDLYGEIKISSEHVQNNQSVRNMLGQRGIEPKNLPAAEDIKRVERRVEKNEKEIEKRTSKLPPKEE